MIKAIPGVATALHPPAKRPDAEPQKQLEDLPLRQLGDATGGTRTHADADTISFPEKKIFFGGQRKIDENKNPLLHGNYTTQVKNYAS